MDRGRSRPEGQRPQPRRTRDTDEYDYEPRPRRRRPPSEHYPSQRQRRRVWPLLLAGCGIGVFLTVLVAAVVVFLAIRNTQNGGNISLPIPGSGSSTFTKVDTTTVQLSTLSQIQVCDKIGNVSIHVDPTASALSVATTKIVHSTNRQAANQEFQRVGVEIQPPGTITNSLTCTRAQSIVPTSIPGAGTPTSIGTPTSTSGSNILLVNVTLPASNGLLQSDSDAVNVAIILPPGVLPTDGPTMQLAVEAPVGNIAIDGISGLLNVIGDKGNIQVNNGVLTGGSQLVTNLGNVSFTGTLGSPANATPQNNFYHISSGQGTIAVTLPATTNVDLDTYTNQGKIVSDFTIPLQTSDGGGMTYQGALNTTSTPPAGVTLVVHMNIGNISIHKVSA